MVEIATGIHQLEIPIPNNPLGHTNAYLVQGDNEYLLIDPGMNTDKAFDSLKRGLSEIGIGFEAITQIIATHAHGDHYGLCGRVKELSQGKILLHRLDVDSIPLMSKSVEERLQRMGQWLLINGVPSLEPSEIQMATQGMPRFMATVMPDVILQGGETISVGSFSLRVLWTPGHSPGHICLYEPVQKILFSGDHILLAITPNISLRDQSVVNPLGDFLNSLNAVKQLDVNLVLPAHGNNFTDLPARVDEIIEHHKRRNSEILESLKTEPKTAYQISTEITWMLDLGGTRFQNLAPWDKRMAVTEALAHLEAMRIEGRVDKFRRDGLTYYQLG